MRSGPCLRSQVVRLDRTGQLDGHFDLFQVGAAIRARTQMRLETATVTTRQGAFEVVGDQLDGLLAYQVSGQEPHGQPSEPRAEDRTIRDRPRWSITRWLASLMESISHMSLLDTQSLRRLGNYDPVLPTGSYLGPPGKSARAAAPDVDRLDPVPTGEAQAHPRGERSGTNGGIAWKPCSRLGRVHRCER